jgi:phthalate 4,5-dioxygenase reductase subunit
VNFLKRQAAMQANTEESKQMMLHVSSGEQIAEGVFSYELRDGNGAELPEFTAGAHITVTVPNGALRSYSLCNNPDERDRYVITVKREDGGRGGSKSLTDGIKKGDLIPVSEPHNQFPLATEAKEYIFIAGGIGITPMLSMMRQLNATGDIPYKMYYLSRWPAATPFLQDLSSPEFKDKVVIHHDQGDPARSFDLWPVLEKSAARRHVYCCGPVGLMDAVRDMTGHWPTSAVHFESFSNPDAAPRPDDKPFTVRLARSGAIVPVPAGISILDALREHGCPVSASCESGTCGTCRTNLLAGEADHRDLVLLEHERADQIMVCVSRATSPELLLDL